MGASGSMPRGQLSKRFDVRDGLGIRLLQQEGLDIAFSVVGREARRRCGARQLGISHCLVGIKDKPAALTALQNQRGGEHPANRLLGDDLNDPGRSAGGRPVVRTRRRLSSRPPWCRCCAPPAGVAMEPSGSWRNASFKGRGRWGRLSRDGWKDRND